MAIETPRHAEFGCEEIHEGKTHAGWMADINRNAAELASTEDRSEDAVFIGKVTLPDPELKRLDAGRDYCLYEHPDEPIQCHRPKGHEGGHAQFPHEDDFKEIPQMQIDAADALKILDILVDNEEYHIKRDEMNAATHRSTDRVRYSPLTTETTNQRERLQKLMREAGVPM